MSGNVIALVAGLCAVVGIAGVAAAYALLVRAPADKALATDLGAAMGLRELNPGAGFKTPNWFGGTHDGREFAVTWANVMYRAAGTPDAHLSLTVAVEAKRDEPLPRPPGKRKGELPPDAKAAADLFRAKHGSLRFGNKTDMRKGVLVPELFPDRPIVALVHQEGSNQGPTEVIALVEELSALARTLED